MLLTQVVAKTFVQMLKDHAVVSLVIERIDDPDDAAFLRVQISYPGQII